MRGGGGCGGIPGLGLLREEIKEFKIKKHKFYVYLNTPHKEWDGGWCMLC